MPLEWRLHVLEARLRSEAGVLVQVRKVDMLELEPEAQLAVMDALGGGGDFPIVLLGSVVACVDGVDQGAVVAMVRGEA